MTLFFGMLVATVLMGCTVAEQDASAVGNQFQRGVQGQGRIIPNDPTSDSFGSDYR